jgi:uncharacterized protein (TIGR03084 family)
MTGVVEVASDMVAEQEALDGVVARLRHEQWQLPTPAAGWTVADQIGHLTYFDGAAATAVADPDEFKRMAAQLASEDTDPDALTLHRDLDPPALLAAWRHNRRRLAEIANTLDDDTRIAWYGPSMGSKSFLTARLMECWAHGQDIVDAVGIERPATDRLRHVAQLGFITRPWSYINRGLIPPDRDLRLELTSPSGATWRFGPDEAADVVTGPALDFCLVVTQRRHVEDTQLRIVGEAARDWLVKAQAFAGPPTEGPPRKGVG